MSTARITKPTRRKAAGGHAHTITLTDGTVTWACEAPGCGFSTAAPLGPAGLQRNAAHWNAHVRAARQAVAA